jgi:uncharacterized double-CXXCG motif protein
MSPTAFIMSQCKYLGPTPFDPFLKLFRINWEFGNNPIIDGLHKWSLPGVKCSICGRIGGTIGCEYPAVDLSILKDTSAYGRRSPVSEREMETLRGPLRPLLPANIPLLPGTQLGPIVGKALAKVGDFAWQKAVTPLICREAFEKLRGYGIQIGGVPAEVKSRTKAQPDLLVLHIEPRAQWDESCLIDSHYCEACGIYKGSFTKPLIVKGSSVPKNADLFRVVWHTMRVIATERFKNAVTEFKLTDITFEEVTVSAS